MNIHQDDKRLIDGQHDHFTDQVNDLAIELQDGAYKLGRARGLEEGKAQRDELKSALEGLLDGLATPNPDDLQASLETAHEAIARAKGGAE